MATMGLVPKVEGIISSEYLMMICLVNWCPLWFESPFWKFLPFIIGLCPFFFLPLERRTWTSSHPFNHPPLWWSNRSSSCRYASFENPPVPGEGRLAADGDRAIDLNYLSHLAPWTANHPGESCKITSFIPQIMQKDKLKILHPEATNLFLLGDFRRELRRLLGELITIAIFVCFFVCDFCWWNLPPPGGWFVKGRPNPSIWCFFLPRWSDAISPSAWW